MSFLLQQFFGVSSGEKYVELRNSYIYIQSRLEWFLCCYKKLVANMHYAKESLIYIYIYIISNVSNENSTSFFKNSKGKFVKIFFLIKIIKGKLQLTYM